MPIAQEGATGGITPQVVPTEIPSSPEAPTIDETEPPTVMLDPEKDMLPQGPRTVEEDEDIHRALVTSAHYPAEGLLGSTRSNYLHVKGYWEEVTGCKLPLASKNQRIFLSAPDEAGWRLCTRPGCFPETKF